MNKNIDENIINAKNGDKKALEQILSSICDTIFNLSLKMLWTVEDAEDASQEIIIKVITNLATFKGDSKFSTWVFQIAVNYLLTTRKHICTNKEISFAKFSSDLNSTTPDEDNLSNTAEISLLEKELRIGCTNAILFCLDKKSRIVFILSSIFELGNKEASDVLSISYDSYRQILSRTNKRISCFMKADCGLVNEKAKCKCRKRINIAIERKRLDPENLIYSKKLVEKKQMAKTITELNELDEIARVYRSNPVYHTPEKVTSELKELLKSTKYSITQN